METPKRHFDKPIPVSTLDGQIEIGLSAVSSIDLGNGLLVIHADGSVTGRIDQAEEAARIFVDALRAEIAAMIGGAL